MSARERGFITQDELFRFIGEQAVKQYSAELRMLELEKELKKKPASLEALGIQATGDIVKELPEDALVAQGEYNGS